MDRVEIMYELGNQMATDEVVADRANVRMANGVVTVKTGRQCVYYVNPWRVVVDLDVVAEPMPLTRRDVSGDRRATA